MKKGILLILSLFVVAGGFIAFNTMAAKKIDNYTVEMSVSRLSCGSCVETIRSAVTALAGASRVETDVAAARSVVYFDPNALKAEQIEATITDSGYPATILFVKNGKGETISGIDLEKYVARIGSRLILRDDFNQSLEEQVQLAEQNKAGTSIKVACQNAWSSMLQQELLLNAAGQFGVSVSDDDLEKRIAEIGSAASEDRAAVRSQLLIDGYLALQFPDRQPNTFELSNLLNKLYSNTAIDVFDENLKRNLSSGNGSGGCGGSCCG